MYVVSMSPPTLIYTIPITTVALKLTSHSPAMSDSSGSGPTSKYSSVLKLLDFHPQLWLTENTSGALVNLVIAAPVALAHEIAKYADMIERGSRYGWGGVIGFAVAGIEFAPAGT
jgi:hypothetical protein